MVVRKFGLMIRMTVIVVVSSFCMTVRMVVSSFFMMTRIVVRSFFMMIRMALAIFWCGRNAIVPMMMALNPICCSFH